MAIDYTKRSAAAAPAAAAGAVPPAPAFSKPSAAPAFPAPGASGSISLTKSKPSVSLVKQSGHMNVNLNWTARPAAPTGGGFLKRLAAAGSGGIDLDLGCLWELTDGTKGVVQALGGTFGSLDAPPYIWLNGDDRSGANAGGEDLVINLGHTAEIRRVLVFACIYEGAPTFDAAQAMVTLSPPSGPAVEVRLDETAGKARMCAVALINGGTNLTVNREMKYFDGGQRLIDEAYGWGMQWARGRK